MKNNQKGFGAIEGLLILVIIGLVSFVGYFVYSNQKKLDATFNDSSKSVQGDANFSKKKSEEKAEKKQSSLAQEQNWLTYASKSSDYLVRLPNGATFISSPDTSFIYSRSEIISSTQKATVVEQSTGGDNPLGLRIGYTEKQHGSLRGEKQNDLKSYTGQTIEKRVYKQVAEPQGIDIPVGATEYSYALYKNDKLLTVSYNVMGEGNPAIVEEMVKTIILM